MSSSCLAWLWLIPNTWSRIPPHDSGPTGPDQLKHPFCCSTTAARLCLARGSWVQQAALLSLLNVNVKHSEAYRLWQAWETTETITPCQLLATVWLDTQLMHAGEADGEPASKKQRGRPKGSKNRRAGEQDAAQESVSGCSKLTLCSWTGCMPTPSPPLLHHLCWAQGHTAALMM